MKKTIKLCVLSTLMLMLPINMGCAMVFLGSGKSATKEDTGFLNSYEGLQEGKMGFPDLYNKDSSVNWSKYKVIAVSDFSSLTKDRSGVSGLQIAKYKNLRQDFADTVCQGLDGTIFKKCNRVSDRLDPTDKSEIQNIKADVVLMGNIKELKEIGGLTVAQLEIKIVEKKTGKELLRMIDRQTTDDDKVTMPAVRKLLKVLNAESEPTAEPAAKPVTTLVEKSVGNPSKQNIPTESEPSVAPQSTSSSPAIMIVIENKTKLRKKPSSKAEVVKNLKKGEKVQVIKKKDDWFQVELASGDVGWCHNSVLTQAK